MPLTGEQRYRCHLVASKIPEAYRPAGWRSLRGEDDALDRCRQYVLDPVPRWLTVIGEEGTGKTTLAACVAKTLAVQDHAPRTFAWTNSAIMLHEIKAALNVRQDPYDRVRSLAAVDLLVIDDLGKERGSESDVEYLYMLLEQRLGACRRTIVTTNLTSQKLGKKLDRAIVDRLRRSGPVVRLTVGWKNANNAQGKGGRTGS